MNWITDRETGLLTKVKAGATVILAVTEDAKRIEQFIHFFGENRVSIIRNKDITLPQKILIADEWKGLLIAELVREGNLYGISYTPMNEEKDLFAKVSNTKFDVEKIDEIIRQTTTIVGIKITGKNTNLDLFLNSIADDDEIFEKGSFVVVFAPEKTLFSPSTLSKIPIIEIPASTEEERRNYIKQQVENSIVEMSDQEIEELVTITSGMNLKQLEITLAESVIVTGGRFDKDYIRKAKSDLITRTDLVEVEMDMKFGFERIGGYEPLKQFFRDYVIDVIENKEEAKKYGLRIPKGVLLFGQAGTGKTVFAKALAKELSLPFIYLDPSNIFRSLVGESEQRMQRIIRLIESMSPCVVFIDEIDSLGMSRDATALDSGATRKVFSILLSYLASERNNLIIGTTNRPQDLDDAFRRVGRFDYTVFTPLPDAEARKEILKVHINVVRKVPAELTEDEISEIAEKTEWFNGAEIENLVIRASQLAFKERAGKVTYRHFEEALKSMRIDVETRRKTEEEYIEMAKKMVNDATFIEKIKKAKVVSSRMNLLARSG